MHPNSFLNSFWRLERRPEVFVAMPFADRFNARFNDVIAPAIRDCGLEVNRVDQSKSGDSVITQIIDGISHAEIVLADISVLGELDERPIRNANVLYEVGLAHAIRLPEEVLLVRDDREQMLFDVSVIPVLQIEFDETGRARTRIASEIDARRLERQSIYDKRVAALADRLSIEELQLIADRGAMGLDEGWGIAPENMKPLSRMPQAIARLLEKDMIRILRKSSDGFATYSWTPLGKVVVHRVHSEYTPITWQVSESKTTHKT